MMFSNLSFLSEGMSDVQNIPCSEHTKPKEMTFTINNEEHVILQGKCLSHQSNYVIYTGTDTKTGDLFTIKEWIVNNIDGEQQQKINDRLNFLMGLHHRNLAQLISFRCDYTPTEQKCTFYILQEFIFGASLSMFLTKNIPTQSDMLRYIAREILNVLEFLKMNDVMQVNITNSSVYLDNNGDLKLTDYGIDESSTDLSQTESNNVSIYQFGILLLSLIQGRVIPNDVQRISLAIPSAFHDFLTKCINRYNEDCSTLIELLNHSFIQKSRSQLACIEFPENQDTIHKTELKQSKSRVESDFETLESLGKGGFGEVFKVRNKFDGRFTALKKIRLDLKDNVPIKKIMEEVNFLSVLNHENIVRYYSSWTDTENISEDDEDEDEEDEYPSYSSLKYSDLSEIVCQSEKDISDIITEVFSVPLDVDYYNEVDETDANYESETDAAVDNMPLMKQNVREMLYIQMELCEGSTLRTAIDKGSLYYDDTRIWRFLREIVEGLVHIHQQNIIHMDLKPVNIFLDSSDHVKIGDFGLATTNVRYKRETFNKNSQENKLAIAGTRLESGSSTSQVGTDLYKAPELSTSARDEKLDMYSLGIILFEMCHKPFVTGMERLVVLTNLRLKEIVFPTDFICSSEKLVAIIRDLLNHNTLERPTSQELLQSKRIPPIVEEQRQQELIKHVIDNPHLKLHKYTMECLFTGSDNFVQNSRMNLGYKNESKLYSIQETVTSIFRIHGGQHLIMSRVMPENSCLNGCTSCRKLITRSGTIVLVPCSSRIPFARYIAKTRNEMWLRRFSVEKVPKSRANRKEVHECVFDIITPINFRELNNFLPDAEILEILNEIKDSFSNLQSNSFCINLNHSLLIKALLLECGYQEHDNYMVIKTAQFLKGIYKNDYVLMQKLLLNGFFSINLARLMIQWFTINNYSSFLLNFSDNKARYMAKNAIEELKSIIEIAEELGMKCEIKIRPGMIHNFEYHSGMLVELVYHTKTKLHILASGGRYDAVIEQFQNLEGIQYRGLNFGVGISVYLENVNQLLKMENCLTLYDVIVYSFNPNAVLKIKTMILRELWSAGICCSFIKAKSDKHLKKFCKTRHIQYAVKLKIVDKGNVSVTVIDWNNRWTVPKEKEVEIDEVVPTLKYLRNLKNRKQRSSLSITELSNIDGGVSVLFKTTETLSTVSQRNYRSKILKQTNICQQRLRGKIVIMAVSIEDISIIMKLTSSVKFDSLISNRCSTDLFIKRYPGQCSYLKVISDQIYKEKARHSAVNLIVYNIDDSLFFIHLI